jgi:electron transfer flavoprotein alpha subunit
LGTNNSKVIVAIGSDTETPTFLLAEYELEAELFAPAGVVKL